MSGFGCFGFGSSSSGGGGGGNTIYTADDALTGDRILDGGGFSLDLGATGAELSDFNVLATDTAFIKRRNSGLLFTTLDLSSVASFKTRSNSMFGDVTFTGSNGKGDLRTTIDNGVNYSGIEIDQVANEVEMYFNNSDSFIKVGATVGAVVKTISGTGLNYVDRAIDEANITTSDKNHIPSWGFIEDNISTIYTSDGTLTGDRTVTGAYSLDINVTGSAQSRFVKSGDGLILQSTNTRIQKGSNVIRLEAGSITVVAAGSGLGIAYDDRAVDEASVVWSTDDNHIPSVGMIKANSGVSDGDKGDITVTGSGSTWTIDNGTITTTKMANFFANSILANNLGSSSAPGYFNSGNLGGADLDNTGFVLGWTGAGAMRAMRADKVLGRSSRLNASNASFTPNAGIYDLEGLTALAVDCTINAPAGTPVEGQKLGIKIKDDGTSRLITLNAIFEDYTGTFPSATTANKTLRFTAEWNSTDSKWMILAWINQP